MPLKTNKKRSHHKAPKKEKRSKTFLKVYSPYIPLLLIVGSGLFLTIKLETSKADGQVKSYAIDMTDNGLLSASNDFRAQSGLPSLSLNSQLDKAAQAKAEDMAKKDYWSHDSPQGLKPWDFIPNDEYKYLKAGENLAYGFITSRSAVLGWMNSAKHKEIMMDKDFSDVGFGIVNIPSYQGKGAQTVVVAMYGQPAALAAASQSSSSAPVIKPAEKPEKISYLQSLTGGKAPWSSFAAGFIIGSILVYLFIKNAIPIKRALVRGENFVVHHPIFDITLVALAALATIVSQTVGIIH